MKKVLFLVSAFLISLSIVLAQESAFKVGNFEVSIDKGGKQLDRANSIPLLFSRSEVAPTSLSGESARRYGVLKQRPEAGSVDLIKLRFQDIHSIRRFRLLYRFELDGRGFVPKGIFIPSQFDERSRPPFLENLIVRRERIDIISVEGREYAWVGDVYRYPDFDNKIGYAIFIVKLGNLVNGWFLIYDQYYEIHSLDGDVSALVTIDKKKLPREIEPPDFQRRQNDMNKKEESFGEGGVMQFDYGNISQLSSGFPPQCERYDENEYYEVRALVLYTAAAEEDVTGYKIDETGHIRFTDINSIITAAIQETNDAYIRSGINNLKIVLAHSQRVDFEEGTSILKARNSLIANQTIKELRDQYEADIVILLTSDIYYRYWGELGVAGTIHLNGDSAYAVVVAKYAYGAIKVFAHEVGHLFGAWHHPDDDKPSRPIYDFAYGHRFEVCAYDIVSEEYLCSRFATIMAYLPSGYIHIPHYSNPNVRYWGQPTGRPDRNNALAHKCSAPIVSSFKSNSLSAWITYETRSFGGYSEYTFFANASNGTGVYSYAWQISYGDPYNYGNVISNQSSFTITLSPGDYYVKLTVTDSEGQQATAVIHIYVYSCETKIDCDDDLSPSISEDYGKTADLSISDVIDFKLYPPYPNPFNPSAEIKFSIPFDVNVTLTVYDVLGREVRRLLDNAFMNAGVHKVIFDGFGLPSGVYIIRLQAGGYIAHQRVLLVK